MKSRTMHSSYNWLYTRKYRQRNAASFKISFDQNTRDDIIDSIKGRVRRHNFFSVFKHVSIGPL